MTCGASTRTSPTMGADVIWEADYVAFAGTTSTRMQLEMTAGDPTEEASASIAHRRASFSVFLVQSVVAV